MKIFLKLKSVDIRFWVRSLGNLHNDVLFLRNGKIFTSSVTGDLINKTSTQSITNERTVFKNPTPTIDNDKQLEKENKNRQDGEKEQQNIFAGNYVKESFDSNQVYGLDRIEKQRSQEIENGFFHRGKKWNKPEKEKYKNKELNAKEDFKTRRNVEGFKGESKSFYGDPDSNAFARTSKLHRFGGERDRYDQLGDNLKTIDWDKTNIKLEREDLYNNEKCNTKLKTLSAEELQNELKKNDIYVSQDIPLNNFITKFSDINFDEPIINYLNSKFEEPTAIQKITWPIALSGKDLIGVAETGSGKTLAYILPCLMHILRHKEKEKKSFRKKEQTKNEHVKNETEEEKEENMKEEIEDVETSTNVYGLVVLPTRELCIQVMNEIKVFEKLLDVKSTAIYGGVPKYYQINNLKRGVDIIVCTPGRLLDFLEGGLINLLKCIYVVIDEADRLLDMGFEKQLRKIMSQINKNKQLLFLTATWPEQVKKLAYDFCSYNPIKIQIGKNELTANKNIEQSVLICSSMDMKKKLLDWLKENYENNKILIFCSTKRSCDNLCKELRYHQYNALSIHGDKQQRERDRILNNYKTDKCNILVATDVASRGLDIKNISAVVNFDIPNTIEDYIHRIGRTGRAGNKGKSILFFSYDYYVPQKMKFARELVKLLNKANQIIPGELKEIAYSH